MSMSLGQSLRQEQKLEMQLTQEQRLMLTQHTFSLRLALIGALRDEQYEPKARCPSCNHALTPIEIINGFNQDPRDFTTSCPKCQHRFAPSIISFGNGSSIELPFFCSAQALDQLRGKHLMTPAELSRHHPAVYRSAIVHHGTITKAFNALSVEYPFAEISDWRNKARPFLGRLSDRVIAECVEVSVKTITKMRDELGIQRYQWCKALAKLKAPKRREG
ncbi:hypothetical protein HZB94_02360 [Candidatus Falkowbacteria bacterium]|nr:hypothetical protein [Candidatus Falkowbacteria bacterium]